jgi:hypothetical protein
MGVIKILNFSVGDRWVKHLQPGLGGEQSIGLDDGGVLKRVFGRPELSAMVHEGVGRSGSVRIVYASVA